MFDKGLVKEMEKITLTTKNHKEVIAQAISILEEGGIVIFPSETCYGAAVDATNQEAVKRLKEYKVLKGQNPVSIAVSDREMAQRYAEINDIAENLYVNYLPGPITVVSKGLGNLPEGVSSKTGTVGIRIPDHEFLRELIKAFGKPITATSANVAYKPPPYSIEKLLEQTPKKSTEMISLIIDDGKLEKNVPSTVLDTTMNNLQVLRIGAIRFDEAIENSVKLLEKVTESTEETIAFGEKVAKEILQSEKSGPVVFALSGELGAGKTQFTKGVGKYLQVNEIVTSPTYTIINEYDISAKDGFKELVHVDTWRVANSNELGRIGLENYVKPENVIVIEWADKFFTEVEEFAKKHKIKRLINIKFRYVSKTKRHIAVYEES